VFNKNVFNVRASYKLETQALVNFLADHRPEENRDDLPQGRSDEVEPEDDRRGHRAARLALVGSASVDRNSSDVKEALGSMSKLNPDAGSARGGENP